MILLLLQAYIIACWEDQIDTVIRLIFKSMIRLILYRIKLIIGKIRLIL